ncbi:MAG: type II toxin-antitoxin system Phd/YefM family antitoxin [Dehalococcoidales bacterium]|nr:type II toxin-antitoxin system Phd/YefM family antitoxin [Dehalococcoidales bacterium]
MQIDSNTVVSMTEANQNFSKVARLVDQYGRAVVFKNNAPRYLVLDFATADKMSLASTEDVLATSKKIMDQYSEAFKELAK